MKIKMNSEESYEEKQELVENMLRDFYKDPNLQITEMKCFKGSKAGDNYMSVIKKVDVKGLLSNKEEFKHSLIVKRPIANISRRELFRCDEAFSNEKNAYKNVIRAMKKFTGSHLCFPKCYYAGSDHAGEKVVVLEDLRTKGYEMVDRLSGGLSLDHCKLVMMELAKFHAVSLSMKQVCAPTFQRAKSSIKEIIYSLEVNDFLPSTIESSLKEGLDSLQNHSNQKGDLTLAIKTLNKLQNNMFTMMKDKILSSQEPWKVLCHGDLWINNLLFRNDVDGNVESVKIVDLQAMRYSSPVSDIIQFLYASTEIELRYDHLHTLINCYHQSFVEAFEQYVLPSHPEAFNMLILQFTPTSILQEFRSKILYGLGTSLCLLPAISFDADNIPDLNDVTLQDFNSGSHTSLIVNRHTEFYHKRLRDIVFEFHEMGFLDEIE